MHSLDLKENIDVVDYVQDDFLPEILQPLNADEIKALEKLLVRKIDLRSLPILIVLFLLNILDRNAIANARLGGLEATLGITDVQYQTAVMILWGLSAHECDNRSTQTLTVYSWVYFHDDSIQYASIQVQAADISSYCGNYLGDRKLRQSIMN